ncbi:MAPEG family protein [Hyphomonas chukchiensis]|uniref:MAPEG family protein n=1 Tax=Hyphomonas chukchiensis TaxID=1280947 RepID=UPI0030F72FDB
MPPLEAAAIYVGLNILLLVVLGLRVALTRRASQVSIGYGGNTVLETRVRVHGNASEYIPAMLVALVAAAYMGIPALWIHVLGVTFTLGRLLHVYGLSANVLPARASGMMLTLIPMAIIALMLIYHGLA